MIRLIHLPIALLFSLSLVNAEAKTYKCADGRKVTYANVPCEDMGLQSIGLVKNRVTVLPATPIAEKSAEGDRMIESKAPDENTDEDIAPRGNTAKPINPLVKKLLN